LAIGIALMQGYLNRGTIGGGDARWYATTVGDFMLQVRAGVFPVWAGQSELSFHGGVFPLRVAPLLHHSVGMIDLVTGQQLPPFRVLNLTLVAMLVAALLICYRVLASVLPHHKWIAAGLSLLYASCPGVLGIAYEQDLYMSFAALPFLPLAFGGALRTFEKNDLASRLLIAGGLAGAWLAHPPIAFWAGLIVAASQLVRLREKGWDRPSRLLDGVTVLTFAALTVYSFASALSLSSQSTTTSLDTLLYEVKNAFPGNWLPLRREIVLENLQLGYGLTVLLLLGAIGAAKHRLRVSGVFFGFSALYLLLLLPVPGLNRFLWSLVPGPILSITNIWPMQRLMPVAAAAVVFGIAALMVSEPGRRRAWRIACSVALLAALAWSGFQARAMVSHALRVAPSFAQSEAYNRKENLVINSLYITLYGEAAAARFASSGVMEPELMHSFYEPLTGRLQRSSIDAIAPGFGPGQTGQPTRRLAGRFAGTRDANPGVLVMDPKITLEPGKRYLLAFGFKDQPYTGTLLLQGTEFLRTYTLPVAGEPFAFGSAPLASRVIPLEVTQDQPLDLTVSFVPSGDAAPYFDFADFELIEYAKEDLPVRVESWIPYRAVVDTREPTVLALPRLYIPGYRATVDGRPVPISRADDGCVTIALAPGQHRIELTYRPPWVVVGAYWVSAPAWLLLLAMAMVHWSGLWPKRRAAEGNRAA
jgi:Bacterial membrane protein YfhO